MHNPFQNSSAAGLEGSLGQPGHQLAETRQAMQANARQLKENSEKIDSIDRKAEDFKNQTGEFLSLAKQLNQKS